MKLARMTQFLLLSVSVVSMTLMLGACDPRPKSKIEGNTLLEMLGSEEGPEVSGVEQTLLNSAKQSEEAKDYGRALQFYQQLADRNAENVDYTIGIANNLRRLQKLDEAEKYYNLALKKDPKMIDALEGKGLVLLAKTEFDESGKVLQQVLQLDRKRWRALNAIGILFVAKDMPQDAMAYYEEALGVRPDEPVVLNNIGLTLALNGDYDRAVTVLKRASTKLHKDDPQKKRADLNLALVYGISGEIELAEQAAQPHLSEAALNNNLGFYSYLSDNEELARGYLNNAISGSPMYYDKAWQNLEAIGGAQLKNKQKPPKEIKKPESVPMVLNLPPIDPPEPVFEDLLATPDNSEVVVEMATPVEPALSETEEEKLAVISGKEKSLEPAMPVEPLLSETDKAPKEILTEKLGEGKKNAVAESAVMAKAMRSETIMQPLAGVAAKNSGAVVPFESSEFSKQSNALLGSATNATLAIQTEASMEAPALTKEQLLAIEKEELEAHEDKSIVKPILNQAMYEPKPQMIGNPDLSTLPMEMLQNPDMAFDAMGGPEEDDIPTVRAPDTASLQQVPTAARIADPAQVKQMAPVVYQKPMQAGGAMIEYEVPLSEEGKPFTTLKRRVEPTEESSAEENVAKATDAKEEEAPHIIDQFLESLF